MRGRAEAGAGDRARVERRIAACAAIVSALLVSGCDDASDPRDGAGCAALLGLYAPGSCSTLGEGVEAYAPRYVLWSDGSTKERYIRLPAATSIDASDPDTWIFPVGTVLWKTFSSGGTRVETRIMRKILPGLGASAWEMRTYAWNAAGTGVVEVTAGLVDVLGTTHDIPPAPGSCEQCHNRGDAVAGFSALQLNHAGAGVSLTDLVTSGRLEGLPSGFDVSQAHLPPTLSATAEAAIGYLHANCGNCHRGALGAGGLELWAPIGITDEAQLPVFTTGVGQVTSNYMAGAMRIDPGSPSTSTVVSRMATRDVPDAGTEDQMPPIASEAVDTAGVAAVSAWIESLP